MIADGIDEFMRMGRNPTIDSSIASALKSVQELQKSATTVAPVFRKPRRQPFVKRVGVK
jgi:hypothetical protein